MLYQDAVDIYAGFRDEPPGAKLHVTESLATGLPIRWRVSDGIVDVYSQLPTGEWVAGALILPDLSFYSFWLCDRIDANDGWFVSHVTSNMNLEIVTKLRTMNLVWMIIITALLSLKRTVSWGEALTRGVGAIACIGGISPRLDHSGSDVTQPSVLGIRGLFVRSNVVDQRFVEIAARDAEDDFLKEGFTDPAHLLDRERLLMLGVNE